MRLEKLLIWSLIAVTGLSNVEAQLKYETGVFVLNEDRFGNNNSTINFLNTQTSEFDYLIVQNNNDNGNLSLGCTAQYGAIYGDNIYIISKQDQDKAEGKLTGGRIVVADASTMKIKKTIPVIYELNGKSAADGRSFVGVREDKGYLGTSNGIFIMDLNSYEIKGRIEGSENPLVTGKEDKSDGLGPLYRNQIGMMIRSHDYVFAIQQDKGVLVINPEKDKIETIIEGCFSTMTQSKDGCIWVGRNSNMSYQNFPYGVFGSTGEMWQGDQLLKIDPKTLETKIIEMPQEYGINQSWYAWSAGSLCASFNQNRLYFTYNSNKWSWFTTSTMFMYDIDTETFTTIYDSSKESRYFLGCAIRINPYDDKIYASLFIDNVNQSYFFYQLDNEGNKLKQYEPIKRYWFPSLFIFPDIHSPEIDDFNQVFLSTNEEVSIDLSSMAKDKDNNDAAITKRIVGISNKKINARIENDELKLSAGEDLIKDNITITVRFNSNGKYEDKVLNVIVNSETGIDESNNLNIRVIGVNNQIKIEGICSPVEISLYDLSGNLIERLITDEDHSFKNLNRGKCYLVRAGSDNYKIIL